MCSDFALPAVGAELLVVSSQLLDAERQVSGMALALRAQSQLDEPKSIRTGALRFEFAEVRQSGAILQLEELRLFSSAESETHIRIRHIANPGGHSPLRQLPHRLHDDDTTSAASKFVDLNFPASGKTILEITLHDHAHVAAYELYTANDNPSRDPTAWHVYSLANGEWKLVHSMTSVLPPTSRHTSYGRFSLDAGVVAPDAQPRSIRADEHWWPRSPSLPPFPPPPLPPPPPSYTGQQLSSSPDATSTSSATSTSTSAAEEAASIDVQPTSTEATIPPAVSRNRWGHLKGSPPSLSLATAASTSPPPPLPELPQLLPPVPPSPPPPPPVLRTPHPLRRLPPPPPLLQSSPGVQPAKVASSATTPRIPYSPNWVAAPRAPTVSAAPTANAAAPTVNAAATVGAAAAIGATRHPSGAPSAPVVSHAGAMDRRAGGLSGAQYPLLLVLLAVVAWYASYRSKRSQRQQEDGDYSSIPRLERSALLDDDEENDAEHGEGGGQGKGGGGEGGGDEGGGTSITFRLSPSAAEIAAASNGFGLGSGRGSNGQGKGKCNPTRGGSPTRSRVYDQHRMRFQQVWPLSEEGSGDDGWGDASDGEAPVAASDNQKQRTATEAKSKRAASGGQSAADAHARAAEKATPGRAAEVPVRAPPRVSEAGDLEQRLMAQSQLVMEQTW